MPYKKKYTKRKRTYRKTFRRYRRKYPMGKLNNRTVVSYRGKFTPVPQYYNTKFFASDATTFTTGTTSPFNQIRVTANDLYDPFLSQGTLQPAYFESFSDLYGTFTVHASKIEIWFNSTSDTTGTGDLTIAVFPAKSTASAALVTNMASAMTQPGVKFGTVTRYGNTKIKLTNYVKIKSIVGVKDIQDNVDLQGTWAASPATIVPWAMCVGSQDTSSNVSAHAYYRITYYATLTRIDNLNQTSNA